MYQRVERRINDLSLYPSIMLLLSPFSMTVRVPLVLSIVAQCYAPCVYLTHTSVLPHNLSPINVRIKSETRSIIADVWKIRISK